MLQESLETCLGAELWDLVQSQGAALTRAAELTAIPSKRPGRAAFRLTFADGRILKGRRVNKPRQAERMARVLGQMDPLHFSQVVAINGSAILEQWIDGKPLYADTCADDIIERCGAILGAVHCLPGPDWQQQSDGSATRWLQVTLANGLQVLSQQGMITADVAELLKTTATAGAPEDGSTGIVHGDFCGQNIIVADRGDPVSIDNETAGFGLHDYDLARTWYRWPMKDAQRQIFRAGYEKMRSMESFDRHIAFWAIYAVVGSLVFRLRAGSASRAVPMQRLSEIVRHLQRGEELPIPSRL